MARRTRRTPAPSQSEPPARASIADRAWLLAILAVVLIFYFDPLLNPNTTPHWDAIDTHYSPQKYFADHVRDGVLPHWTPYLFSGFPFLADPQVGAWYPLNWPFFLAGITPKAIEAEVAMHALLGMVGMYFLLRRFFDSHAGALAGAIFFALGGFFTDHAQHLGIFAAPCWLPWLCLFLLRSLDGSWRVWLRWTSAAALAAGAAILAGSFQAALYVFYGLALFAAGIVVARRESVARAIGFVACTTLLATLLSAVMTLPGLELTANSVRNAVNYGSSTERILRLGALANLVWPNATGYLSGNPVGESNYYLYSGILLVPLALIGLRDLRVRILAALLVGLTIWYMLGPAFGLYKLGAILPALHRVRAPIHAWFLAGFGLSLAAASGVDWLSRRFNFDTTKQVLLLVFIFADLFYFNSWVNPAGYERANFDQVYGSPLENTRQKIALSVPRETRFQGPDALSPLGPLNHPLDLHLETTYGYNPLILTRYEEYRKAMQRNPALLAGLNVSRRLDTKQGAVLDVPEILPRAYFAKSIMLASNDSASRASLDTLNPGTQTIVTASTAPHVDAQAAVTSLTLQEQELRVKYKTPNPTLLRVAIPYFPGWHASADGKDLPILIADHAFLGVEVPAGEKELVLQFHSNYFSTGALLSGLTFLALAAVQFWLAKSQV